MQAYLDIVRKILERGEVKHNRTGVDTIAIAGAMFQHDMADGFPLLTTKKIPLRLPASELEFFLRGLTDKRWLLERNNHIWDEWRNPSTGDDNDLGAIYGYQWRHFNQPYKLGAGAASDQPTAADQIQSIVNKLKTDPNDRRMLALSWNPLQLGEMALPSCFILHQVNVINGRLNLLWYQRSCDFFLGVPFDIASHALLLHLYAKEAGLKEGILTGFFADAHIYVNHIEQMKEQLARAPRALPRIETRVWDGIFEWEYTDTELIGYDPHPAIKGAVAV